MSPCWPLSLVRALSRRVQRARGARTLVAGATVTVAALVALWTLPSGGLPGAGGTESLALAGPLAASATVHVGPGFTNTFNPLTVTVNVGDNVSWTWDTPSTHTTTSGTCIGFSCTPDGLWDSGFKSGPPDFVFTFNVAPGTYNYYCSLHGSAMTGQVVVAAAGGATATLTPTATTTPSSTRTATSTATATTPAGATATATPTATATTVGGPSSTPSPTPVACTPRPAVVVAVVGSGPDRLQTTITAGGSGNQLRRLQFGAATNALIDIPGGPTGSTGNVTVTLAAGTQQTTFLVRRVGSGTSGTVPLTVVDNCGDWPTFVGAGPNGWPPAPPPAGASAPASASATIGGPAPSTASVAPPSTAASVQPSGAVIPPASATGGRSAAIPLLAPASAAGRGAPPAMAGPALPASPAGVLASAGAFGAGPIGSLAASGPVGPGPTNAGVPAAGVFGGWPSPASRPPPASTLYPAPVFYPLLPAVLPPWEWPAAPWQPPTNQREPGAVLLPDGVTPEE